MPRLSGGLVKPRSHVLTANSTKNWLSDESLEAFMATVDAPEAVLV